MKPETLAKRAETLRLKKARAAEHERWEKRADRVEKLERLAADRGATAAESANARAKAERLRNMTKKPPSRYSKPPPTLAEIKAMAMARGKTPPASPAPPPAKALAAAPRQPTPRAQTASAREEALTAEIARLNRKIARLEAALKQATEPVPAGKPGRKPLGERAMTAAERMRKMRLRNAAQ